MRPNTQIFIELLLFRDVIQFIGVFIVPANRIRDILAVACQIENAEPVRRGGKLRVLWLVGLEISPAYCVHLILQLSE